MKYIFCLVIVFTLFACETQQNKSENLYAEKESSLKLVDSLIIDVGLLFKGQHTGIFYNKIQQENQYYFANTVSDKIIKIFNKKGELQDTVSLKQVAKEKFQIFDFDIISPDTVLVLSKFASRLYAINKNGEIWKRWDLSKILPNDSLYFHTLRSSYSGGFITNSNDLIFSHKLGHQRGVGNSENDLFELTAKAWSSPQVFKIQHIFSDSIQVDAGFKMYQHIYPNEAYNWNIEFKKMVVLDSSVLIFSIFTDQLFEVDLNNLTLKNKYTISSQFEKIKQYPLNQKKVNLDHLFELAMKLSEKTATPSSLVYNPSLKHTYVSILKRIPAETQIVETRYPYILTVYDENFKQLADVDSGCNSTRSFDFPHRERINDSNPCFCRRL